MTKRAILEDCPDGKGGFPRHFGALIQPLASILFLALFPLLVSAERHERAVDGWRPLHYDVSLRLSYQITEISTARTEITLLALKDNLKVVDLDFGTMLLDSVTVDGQPARFERKPELLNVLLPHPVRNGNTVNIAVAYHGRPQDGLVLATDRDGKPSATGDNWPNRVHYWIPCLDHPSAKATVTFTVTAPQRDLVIANGRFAGMTSNSDSTSTWKYDEAQPIPPYCMIIAVNEGFGLEAGELPQTIKPLFFCVPQHDRAYAVKGFSTAWLAVEFYSQAIAPYPYEKLALIIGATRYGGMENSSAIVFTSTLFDPRPNEAMSARFGIPRRIEDVVAHEIAHQWFGDSATESTWADLWLSEGFATYFAGLFIEKYEGEDAFHEYLKRAADRYLRYESQKRAPIHDTETEDLNKLLNANNYEKGAWILHMLRTRLGDEAFFRGLRAYYQAHRDANATTEDLRAALEKASGRDLKDFFARWVYEAGHPQYHLTWNWKDVTEKNGTLTITLRQAQSDRAFLDPVPIEVMSQAGKQRLTLQPVEKVTTRELRLPSKPTAIRLDPNDTLLKEAKENLSARRHTRHWNEKPPS